MFGAPANKIVTEQDKCYWLKIHLEILVNTLDAMQIWIFPKNLIFSPLFVLDYFVDDTGMRRSDLLNQYLKDIEDQIETEEDLAEKKTLVDKVLDRLINKVRLQPYIIQS